MSISFQGNTLTASATLDSSLGTTSSNPAISANHILAANPSAASGLYWIQPQGFGSAQQIYCDMTADGGGWMLVSANDARDTTIPGGTSRQSTSYELDRSGALVGTQGVSPNGDYIIGSMINTLAFDRVRVTAWGRGSTNSSTSWPSTLGTYITAIWNLNKKGSDRLTEVVPRSNVTLSGNSSLASAAGYFVLDSIKQDRSLGGYTANSQQTTIGAAGVLGSGGDPTDGTYLGHGSSEGSYEGWYDSSNSSADSQGYATWVKDSTNYSNGFIIPAGYTLIGGGAGSGVFAPGRVVNITRFQSSTRTSLSSTSSNTLWSAGNVNKQISNSTLFIMGQLVFSGWRDGECGAWWQIGSSGIRRDGIVASAFPGSDGTVTIKGGWHIKCSYITSSTGNLAVSFGWTTANGANRSPGAVWNPNASDDARSQQHTSDIMIIEVAL